MGKAYTNRSRIFYSNLNGRRKIMSDKKPKRVEVSTEVELKADLETYRKQVLDLGASGAKIISTDQVYVDPRVRAKCSIPKCPGYGSSAHCPPYTLETDKMKELVRSYQYALLVKLDVDPSVISAEGSGLEEVNGNLVPKKGARELERLYRQINDMVTAIESQAFYDGHYLSISLSAGGCNFILCNRQECQVLKNKPCRFPLRARPSMEGSGLNVYRMVAEAGWEIYPIGSSCKIADAPRGVLAGLVLVG
jgi:predicted metal-binding protein